MKIYLASPYSTPMPEYLKPLTVKHTLSRRYCAAADAVHKLMQSGHIVYSPIVSCHNLALRHDLPKDSDYWWNTNLSFIMWSDAVIILKYPGWDRSIGVDREMKMAVRIKKPLGFIKHKSDKLDFLSEETEEEEDVA